MFAYIYILSYIISQTLLFCTGWPEEHAGIFLFGPVVHFLSLYTVSQQVHFSNSQRRPHATRYFFLFYCSLCTSFKTEHLPKHILKFVFIHFFFVWGGGSCKCNSTVHIQIYRPSVSVLHLNYIWLAYQLYIHYKAGLCSTLQLINPTYISLFSDG